jgi:hypothetical protein
MNHCLGQRGSAGGVGAAHGCATATDGIAGSMLMKAGQGRALALTIRRVLGQRVTSQP